MDRKNFILRITGSMLLAIPVISVLGCSDSGDDDPNGPPVGGEKDCLKNGTKSSIGSNHGHSLVVSKADVLSGSEKQYAIKGSSGHNHDITISSANFDKLKTNQQVSVVSSSDSGHTHSVIVSCA